MTLQDILESKLIKVVKVHHDKTVAETIKVLEEMNVSGVFVVDDHDNLSGIFTEKDVIRCIASGIPVADTVVGVMKRSDLITYDPSTEVSKAIAIASRNKKRHLPVLEGDRIKGMITYRDLVSYLLPEICFMAETM